MTKIELGIKLMKYNQENHRCELCDEIHIYMIAIQGTIKQVGLCKWCFFLGEDDGEALKTMIEEGEIE